MKKFKITIIISVALFCPARLLAQASYYVSPYGKDANPGTQTKPFASISKAIKEAQLIA